MTPKNKKIIIGTVAGIIALAFVIKLLFFKTEFHYAGTIEATKIDVPVRISSVINSLKADEGDKVQAGQQLMTLSCEDYILNAQLANENYLRAEQLYKDGSMSKQDYDILKNKKDDADLQVSWCTIHAPIKGTILTRYHEPGEMVSPGTKLFTMANIKDIYAYIYVPQPLIATLSLNQKLTGILPEVKDRKFEGIITWISEEAEFTPKNVQTREERTRLVYAVKVSFNNEDEMLKPGMTIEVALPK